MLSCKYCSSKSYVKNGFVQGKQRYKCRQCSRTFTDTPPRGKPYTVKVFALLLYLSGVSQLRIARLLNVSDVAVLKWLRQWAEQCGPLPAPEGNDIIIEIDEMCSFVGSKKTVSGSGRLCVHIQAGL